MPKLKPKSNDSDLTLPAAAMGIIPRNGAQALLLTVIFHPDTARIGQYAMLPKNTAGVPWVLGRTRAAFAARGETGASSLDDLHVSRNAVQFFTADKSITLKRFPGSSRCRVGDQELYDSISLDCQRLRDGVPLLLGHSVVLLLRLARRATTNACAGLGAAQLRGSSAAMEHIRLQVQQAANSGLDVLILGETGTGKELVASAIHADSNRSAAPMVRVNMAAIPNELAAAALFGSTRGAYTGAEQATCGYFEQAKGGSLFLDEIGATSAAVQPLLLRALQEREIQQVGGAVKTVDVRIISATEANIDDAGGGFRSALRHRLGSCEIVLPALRQHPEDIGELLLYFLRNSTAAGVCEGFFPHQKSSSKHIAAWAMLFFDFLAYRWPGNVRELKNFAQQVVLSSEKTPIITPRMHALLSAACAIDRASCGAAKRRRLQDVDDQTFDSVMSANGYEVMRVAAALGVSRAAVYRRIQESSVYRLATSIEPEELRQVLQQCNGDSQAMASHLRVPIKSLRHRMRAFNLDWH